MLELIMLGLVVLGVFIPLLQALVKPPPVKAKELILKSSVADISNKPLIAKIDVMKLIADVDHSNIRRELVEQIFTDRRPIKLQALDVQQRLVEAGYETELLAEPQIIRINFSKGEITDTIALVERSV